VRSDRIRDIGIVLFMIDLLLLLLVLVVMVMVVIWIVQQTG